MLDQAINLDCLTSKAIFYNPDLPDGQGQLHVIEFRKMYKHSVNGNYPIKEDIDFYFNIPYADILQDDIFAGRTNSKYGKISKNINFVNFYNTKKLYTNDSEYTFGLMRVMFEDFKLRNSLVGPAFFDHICKYNGDASQFWLDFMIGANRASIFNPATYKGILEEVFTGETLFAPVMGWNSYQIAFYNSNFKKFIATDVIPDVVDNGHLLHNEFEQYRDKSIFELEEKKVDLYLCPSEIGRAHV